MREVFADTGYWIALWDSRDALHPRAKSATKRLESSAIVTTQMVLAEALKHMARDEFLRSIAVQMMRRLRDAPEVEIVPQTSEQFWAAFDFYAARTDKSWSLTDCASFVLMNERGIRDALAHDHDFEQAGFQPLLK